MEELILRTLRRRREIEELLELRRMLEPGVARHWRPRPARGTIWPPCGVSSWEWRGGTEPDYMRYGHPVPSRRRARATGNRRLASAIEEISAELNDVISLLPESDTWHGRISGEHEAIFAAVEARDPRAAEAAMDRHVASSDQGIRAVLEVIRRWSSRTVDESKGGMTMKALLAQLACRIGDVEGNTARAIDAIRSHPAVEIAVFPELTSAATPTAISTSSHGRSTPTRCGRSRRLLRRRRQPS